MGNVQMEADQIRYKNASYRTVAEAIAAALAGGGGLDDRVEALEETVGDDTGGLVKDVDDLETTVATLYPNVYSSEEVKIGTWDGEDLFRKKYTGNMPNNTEVDIPTGLSNITIRHMFGTSEDTVGFGTLPFAAANPRGFYYKKSNNCINLYTTDATSGTFEIVMEYTKNPVPENNNR